MSFVFDNKRWTKSVRDNMATHGVSYRKLEEKTKISLSRLHRISWGRDDPRLGDMIAISNALDICPVEFFDEKEYQKRLF